MFTRETLKGALAVVLAALILYAAFATHQLYWWKQHADVRGWRADVSFAYLAEQVTLPNGQVVTRGQLLDALAQQLAQSQVAPHPKK